MTHVAGDKPEFNEVDICAIHQETEAELHPTHIGHSNGNGDVDKEILSCATTNQNREI